MISIGCVLRKRLLGEELPIARWSLGRFGTSINAFAFLYSGFAIVFSCFPPAVPVTPSTVNWTPFVWFAVLVFAMVVYVLHGKKNYTAPLVFVEGRRVGNMSLQEVD